MKKGPKSALAGVCAGAVTGLLGAGGGIVLVLLLKEKGEDPEAFSLSAAVMAPICLTALLTSGQTPENALPYVLGGGIGGLAAGLWGRRVPSLWLHRIFGALLILGGLRWIF